MRRISILMVFVLWTAIRAPGSVIAQPQELPDGAAKALFDEGVVLASRREFLLAAEKFRAAHDRAPTPAALFAWAQAERLGGNCVRAVPLYRKFLEGTPAADHSEAAQIGLRRCAESDPTPAPASAPAPVAVAPVKAPALVVAVPQMPMPVGPRPAPVVRTDWLSAGLLTAGTVALGVGTTLVVLSVSEENAAKNATVYDDYLGRMERVRLQRPLGIGVGLLGAGVVALGLYRVFGTASLERTAVVPDLRARGVIVRRTF